MNLMRLKQIFFLHFFLHFLISNPNLDGSDDDFGEEVDDNGPEELEDEDDEDPDHDVEDEEESSLSNPLKKSSDPISVLPFIRVRRVFRGARRLVRRFRRRRSRRRRGGRRFRRGRRRGRG